MNKRLGGVNQHGDLNDFINCFFKKSRLSSFFLQESEISMGRSGGK